MRSIIRFAALSAALVGASVSFGLTTAEAQVATSEAANFVGDWGVSINADGQTFTIEVGIEDEAGNLAAEVSAQGSSTKVSRITKTGENLVLAYQMDAQGQRVPVVITLTPEGSELAAKLDFADGMFVANGRGTKK